MQPHLPHSRNAHIAAFIAVVFLHGGLMWWQLAPKPPVVLPQQNVVQISMISVTEPAPQPVAEPTPEPAPKVAPAEKGMVKQKPEPKKAEQEPKPVAKEQPKPTQPAPVADVAVQQTAYSEPVPADYLRNPPPEYPRAALRRKQEGTVMVAVRVDTQGQPMRVWVERTCGHRLLDDAALEAVQKWRFIPARRGAEVVEANVVVPVEFRIN
jgi:periplasmic protein TonB